MCESVCITAERSLKREHGKFLHCVFESRHELLLVANFLWTLVVVCIYFKHIGKGGRVVETMSCSVHKKKRRASWFLLFSESYMVEKGGFLWCWIGMNRKFHYCCPTAIVHKVEGDKKFLKKSVVFFSLLCFSPVVICQFILMESNCVLFASGAWRRQMVHLTWRCLFRFISRGIRKSCVCIGIVHQVS